jgi:hypothetical protein
MNNKLLFLLLILVVSLLLASFLGGKYYEGFTPSTAIIYTSSDGSKAYYDKSSNEIKITYNDTSIILPKTGSDNVTIGTRNIDVDVFSNSDGYKASLGTNPSTNNSMIISYTKDGKVDKIYTTTDSSSTTDTSSTTDSSSSMSDYINVFMKGFDYGKQYSSNNNTSNNNSTSNDSTSYDNYNHYSGSAYPTIFYGPAGQTARVIQNGTSITIVVTTQNGNTEIYYIDNNAQPGVKKFYGPNGNNATIVSGNDGKKALKITTNDGKTIIFTADNTYNYQSVDKTMFEGDTSNKYPTYNDAFTTQSNAQGIPKSMIPPGQEDLYILKSEVVPPVCPKCPDPILKCEDKKCPPCKPCGRCDEPDFTCQKVPNYNALAKKDFIPIPVLNDFSTFGM